MGGFVALGSGCALRPPAPARNEMVVKADFDELWQLCQSDLKHRGFRLDRVDRRSGLIQTYPMIGSQWFEFWGRDLLTPAAWAEASLHTIRRSIRINLESMQNHQARLVCRVSVEKLSLPPSTVSGSVWAGNIFWDTAGRNPGWNDSVPAGRTGQTWISLGRDPDLEADFYRTIETTLEKSGKG